MISGDGCSRVCVVECGFSCARVSSSSPDMCYHECGDGIKASVEECDDGNSVSDDGCSEDCSLESMKFICLPSPCKRTTCQELSAITQCDDVVAFQIQQTAASLSESVWSHSALPVVTVFQMHCDYSIDGSSASTTQNISTGSCSDFVCRMQQENLPPGMSLSCSVRALCHPFGWSTWKVDSIQVVGVPSSPLDPMIEQSSTMDPCKTVWTIHWSEPLDHGDKRPPGSLERVPLMGFDVYIACGAEEVIFPVGMMFSISLQAVWDCDDGSDGCIGDSVAGNFVMRSAEYPGRSLSCRRGEYVSAQISARNALFSGAKSIPTSLRALGLPAKVTGLRAVELSGMINVAWTQVFPMNSIRLRAWHAPAYICVHRMLVIDIECAHTTIRPHN